MASSIDCVRTSVELWSKLVFRAGSFLKDLAELGSGMCNLSFMTVQT